MKRARRSYWRYRLQRFLQHTTVRRLQNFLLAHIEYRLGVCRVRSLPPLMYIDPINYCNLRCAICPTGQRVLGRPSGRMTLDFFLSLIDEVGDYIYFLNLYNWGEPLLHPQIFDMVEYATKKGISVRISSNLNHMNAQQVHRIVASGLEELSVDLDGAYQETYQQYRVGGDLKVVVDNIQKIVEEKHRAHSPFPLITARALEMRVNEHEIMDIANLAWDIGVDRFQTVPLYVNLERPQDVERWLPQMPTKRTEFRARSTTPRKCDQLWLNLTVSWDGGVFPCCWFHQEEYDFGNVSQGQSIKDVLNNDSFVSTRCYIAGKSSIVPSTICARCKGYPEYEYYY